LRGRVRVASHRNEQQRIREQLDEARYGPPLLVPVDRIDPNPHNPRRVFNEDALNELAESIKHWKQLQPIVVRRAGERFELICGERRWRAHQRAGLETIWAVERDASDTEAYALALIENMQRVDLSHAEKVAALDQLGELAQEGGLRQTARRLRMSPGWLSVQLSMRKDPIIYPALEAGRVSFGQAAVLLRAPAHARRSLLDRTLRRRAGIAEIQNWVRDVRRQEQSARVDIAARLAVSDGGSEVADPLRVLSSILEQLQALTPPRRARERQALQAISQRAQELLGEDAARRPRATGQRR
jgi:ParB/RepB/Spo0J family partition protein